MKRLFVVLFALTVVALMLNGCAAPKVAIYEDRPLNGNIENKFVFRSAATQMFGVRAKFQDRPQLRPEYRLLTNGKSTTFVDTGDWDAEFWIVRWDPVADSPIGEEMKVSNFKLNSFANREVVVTDLMLSGMSIQGGLLTNWLGYSIDVDVQHGQIVTIASGETKVVQVVACGPGSKVDISWRPSNALDGEHWYTFEHDIDHDPKGTIVWVDGQPVETGWGLNIRDEHPSWKKRRY